MPLQAYPRTPITLPVADRRVADTLVRQQAMFLQLTHTQAEDGQCRATVTVRVDLYAAAGDGYGQRLMGNGFSSYTVQLVAANDTLVDAQTGAILAIQLPGQSGADWQAHLDSFSQATMLQGDFFEYLRENQPIKIGDMIRQYIQQADAAGKFA